MSHKNITSSLLDIIMCDFPCYTMTNSSIDSLEFTDDCGNIYTWNINTPHLVTETFKADGVTISIPIAYMFKASNSFGRFYREVINQRLVNAFDYTSNYGNVIELNTPKLDYFNPDILVMLDKFSKSENGVLAISSAMGTGKSNLIEKIVGDLTKKSVLFISPRKTFSSEICNRYENILHYKYINSWSKGDSLVCQVDSLHKIKDFDSFDFVVFDEVESIFEHFSEMNARDDFHKQAIKDIIYNLLKKKVIFCDACLRDRTLIDAFCRGNYGYRDIFTIKNTYKDDVVAVEHKGWKQLTDKILNTLAFNEDNNKIVTVSVTSLTHLKGVKKELKAKGYRVMEITSESKDADKESLYRLLLKEGAGKNELPYDVFMYSPTVTVGINILNDVAKHFHYDFGHSVSALASFQMIKRSRHAKIIHCYVKGCNKKGKIGYLSSVKACIARYGKKYLTDADHITFLTQSINTFYSNNANLVFNLMLNKGFKTVIKCIM